MFNRQQAVVLDLMWVLDRVNFGRCKIEENLPWLATPHPEAEKGLREPTSVVVVLGKPEDYTDEEIEKLANFARAKTLEHLKIHGHKFDRSPILIGKSLRRDGAWVRKRATWNSGIIHSATLDEAIAAMNGS